MDDVQIGSDNLPIPVHEQIVLVSKNNPSITKVVLLDEDDDGQTVTADQVVSLLRGLQRNTNVDYLDLFRTHDDELRRTVCQRLLPPLLRENSTIQRLRFPFRMSNAELAPTADILCNNNTNTTVKVLYLALCDIRGREGGEIIARLIQNNRHIETIELCGNDLEPAGAACIAAALGRDCALISLDLYGCGVSDEGMASLCAALQVNTSLQVIRLSSNGITEEGYRSLASCLPRASGLKEIEFRWEPGQVSSACVHQMMEGLRKNRSLLRVACDCDNLSEEQKGHWNDCIEFVCARNAIESHLDEVRNRTGSIAAAPTTMPIPMDHLLRWCHRRRGNAELGASLMYRLLRSRADEVFSRID